MAGLGVATLLALMLACKPPTAPLPNVVLVTIDTLRADRIGAYGSSVRTPHFDRMASEGLLFENAVAPMPMTRPSISG